MTVQRDLHHHGFGQAQGLGIEVDGVTLDDARVFQPLHPCSARRAAQPHRLAYFLKAGAAIALKFSKNFPVYFVHAGRLSADSE